MKLENLQPKKSYKIKNDESKYKEYIFEFIEENKGTYLFMLYVSLECRGICGFGKDIIEELEQIN